MRLPDTYSRTSSNVSKIDELRNGAPVPAFAAGAVLLLSKEGMDYVSRKEKTGQEPGREKANLPLRFTICPRA